MVWVDLVTDDLEAAKSFYAALFGWTYEDDAGYVKILRDGSAIAGMVRARPGSPAADEWVGNLSVADVDAAASLVAASGGTVERAPVTSPTRGRVALVVDPGGSLVLLLRAAQGDPLDRETPVGGFIWHELWAHDADAAIRFYRALAGYEAERAGAEDPPYWLLKSQDRLRAGVIEAPPEIPSLWLPYVRVEDIATSVERAMALGARLVMQDDDAAILVDPSGAPIGVQTWARGEGVL
jgi:predicted enzyme related to lactoylglutathione lyase